MTIKTLAEIHTIISRTIDANQEYLTELDAQNGDGDLGISMSKGFRAVAEFFSTTDIEDLGMALNKAANSLNEAAPSTLGTILSFGMKGMAKALRGKTDAGLSEVGEALLEGIENITAKAGSKAGEKTILDSLYPAVKVIAAYKGTNIAEVTAEAARAAADGSESTRKMKAVWGRAAYFAEKSIGILDGGSVVGKLIFEGAADWAASKI